jgi:Zn-dependent peptidase ImmA (M78 family)
LVHPGQLFVHTHGKIETIDDVLPYADFLRKESGIASDLPVDLGIILNHFGLPKPHLTALPNQQALLVNPECGFILINSEDPEQRQRFSLAHELGEMLFSTLPQGNGLLRLPGGFRERTKEQLCNRIAANLLMPPSYVQQLMQQEGINFKCARLLSIKCDVSFTAALVQLACLSPKQHTVILWKMNNKPTEVKNNHGPEQLSFFHVSSQISTKKLRIEWSIGSSHSPVIPKYKSTEDSSIISTAWKTNSFTSGKERMTFNNRNSAWYYSENFPFENTGERFVISLIERLG